MNAHSHLVTNHEHFECWLKRRYTFQTEKRFELLTFLEDNDIQTRVTFAGNVTRHPVYREYLQDFENSDLIMKNGFLLGAHHGLTIEDVDYVCDKIKEFFNK